MGGAWSCCANKRGRDPDDDIAPMPTKSAKAANFWVPNNTGRGYDKDYDIEHKPIGAGAFGTVKTVVSKRTGERRALKTIRKSTKTWLGGSATHASDHELLVTEIDINLGLDHPNIAKLFNVYEDSRAVYMVLELCQGKDILALIAEQKRLSEPISAFVMDSLLSAVAYLHSTSVSICHRDLKLDNMLLKKNTPWNDNTIKLIDFGLAQRFTPGETKLTGKVGTPSYIPPEVYALKNYNEKADVWSCGVIMYTLLSGFFPFSGNKESDIYMSVTTDKLEFDDDIWKGIDQGAKDLITMMLYKDPVQRVSAMAARHHEWILDRQEHCTGERSSLLVRGTLDAQQYANLQAFSAKTRFEKVAATMVAHLLDDSEIEQIQRKFKALDANGDGKLSLKEIEEAITGEGLKDDLQELFDEIDFNSSSQIEYSTFIASMMDERYFHKEEHLWRAFKSMDQNNVGAITVQELAKALQDLDSSDAPVTADEIKRIMEKADTNGDGQITFDEFAALICGKTHGVTVSEGKNSPD